MFSTDPRLYLLSLLIFFARSSVSFLSSACRTLEKAKEMAGTRARTTAIALDVKNSEALLEAVKQHDLVVRWAMDRQTGRERERGRET